MSYPDHVYGKEQELIEQYIQKGPQQLAKDLGMTAKEWRVTFDHLVMNHNLLYKHVIANLDYFTEQYIEHGFAKIKKLLDAFEEKYDDRLEAIFDLLAIAKSAIYEHVTLHRSRYLQAFQIHGADFIKKILRLHKDKYSSQWKDVIKLLLEESYIPNLEENIFESRLKNFTELQINGHTHQGLEGDAKEFIKKS